MNIFVCCLLISHNNPEDIITDTVDLVEINHYYNGKTGHHILDQFIFYDFVGYNEKIISKDDVEEKETPYKVISWLVIKEEKGRRKPTQKEKEEFIKLWKFSMGKNPSQKILDNFTIYIGYDNINLPKRSHYYRFLFTEYLTLRIIRSKTISETYTEFDPEVINRKYFSREVRRRLTPQWKR